jgi:hypothetical protein
MSGTTAPWGSTLNRGSASCAAALALASLAFRAFDVAAEYDEAVRAVVDVDFVLAELLCAATGNTAAHSTANRQTAPARPIRRQLSNAAAIIRNHQ